jgi:hypothetical protein
MPHPRPLEGGRVESCGLRGVKLGEGGRRMRLWLTGHVGRISVGQRLEGSRISILVD